MSDIKVSRRGVYYDLSLSPYEVITPYGDFFKFSSKKRMELYTRDVVKEIERLDKLLDRHQIRDEIPKEIIILLKRAVYKSFYKKIEG